MGSGGASSDDDPYLFATNMIMRRAGKDAAWESKHMVRLCKRTIEDILKAGTSWPAFKNAVEKKSNWSTLRSMCFFQNQALLEFAEKHKWVTLKSLPGDSGCGAWILDIILDVVEREHHDLEEAKDQFEELVCNEVKISEAYDNTHKTEEAYMNKRDVWLAVYDLLKDKKNVQSANLRDLSGCEKKLMDLAQNIDRLPQDNSISALVLLRRAWTLVDLFKSTATLYKFIAKATFFLSITAGLLVVVGSTVAMLYPEIIPAEREQYILLGLALAATAIQGWTTILEPSKKWMQLRGGSLALQKEIWKFRTRVGEYNTSEGGLTSVSRVGAERRAELELQGFIDATLERVLSASGLKETDFFAISTCTDDVYRRPDEPKKTAMGSGRPKGLWVRLLGVYHRHHQYPTRSTMSKQSKGESIEEVEYECAGIGDNHHSPATPHEYVRFRVIPAKAFYQSRIPTYACRKRLFQFIILASSILSALLASIELYKWTAIIAAIASTCVAWQEFTGVSKKLQRYSTVVASLDGILMWWQSLPSVDQAVVTNVEALVERTEGLLGSEQSAWLSDAQRKQEQQQQQQEQQQQQQKQVVGPSSRGNKGEAGARGKDHF